MKARIAMDPASKAGILIVTPETPVEAFALHHWWSNWTEGGVGDNSSLFSVEVTLPAAEVE